MRSPWFVSGSVLTLSWVMHRILTVCEEREAMSETTPLALDFTQENAILQLLPRAPLLSSHQLGWDGIHAQYHQQPAWETPESCGSHHTIIVSHFKQLTKTERMLDGCRQSEQAFTGDIAIIPANVQHKVIWDREGDFTLLFLEPIFVAQAAPETIDADHVKILPHFATPDPVIYRIGLLLKSELESNGLGSRLYADSLFTALSVNLLRRYSARKSAVRDFTGGLPKRKLQQAMEYIHDHLAEDLSLREIAAFLQMSPNYFTSLFKQSTGLSTHQYVIQCRIEKTKRLLTKPDLSIVEVSQQVGFQSQSHFINVFRKQTGMTPKAYRKARK